MHQRTPMQAHDFLSGGRSPAPSKRAGWYFGLLALGKGLKIGGIFLVSDLLKSIHVCQLLFILKLLATGTLFLVQRPLSRGKALTRPQWAKVAQLGVLQGAVQMLWFYGITQCGPLRSVLIFESSPVVVAATLGTLASACRAAPSKVRGTVFMVLGFLALCLLDRDLTMEHDHGGAHNHQSGFSNLFYHIVNWVGVADHKGGVVLLALASVLQLGYCTAEKRLGVELEGSKKTHALSSLTSTVALAPLALLVTVSGASQNLHNDSTLHLILLTVLGSIFVFVADFYVESVSSPHLNSVVIARYCPILMFCLAFIVSHMWFPAARLSTAEDILHGHGTAGMEHGLSGGVFLTAVFFAVGSWTLTGAEGPRARAGEFIGYDSAGSPLYLHGEDFLRRTSSSLASFAKTTMAQIWAAPDSRSIFYFLMLNLFFCGVEFLYGMMTNSLGLISDAFHMLFDCTALVMGLVASVMSRWRATGGFSYGYGRVEVLSGFINALFLVVISFFILVEALQRLVDPPHIHAEKLFVVSVLGLLINFFGLYAFSHAHSHGGKACGGDGHAHAANDHGHSHGDNDHGHSHDAAPAESSGGGGTNANMKGVYLHILADTGGSVAVILSSVVIKYLGWHWMDPLCSLLLAALIFCSTLPLLTESTQTIIQRTPMDIEESFHSILEKVLAVDGVVSYSDAHLWELKSGSWVASLRVQVVAHAAEQAVTGSITSLLRGIGIQETCVQVEKEAFLAAIPSILPNYPLPQRVSRTALSDTLFVRST